MTRIVGDALLIAYSFAWAPLNLQYDFGRQFRNYFGRDGLIAIDAVF